MGLSTRIGYLHSLGVGVVRLNSIFPSKSKHYPDYFQNVSTLAEIDEVLGNKKDLKFVADSLHARNMSLVLDLPIYPLIRELNEPQDIENNQTMAVLSSDNYSDNDEVILKALQLWIGLGVDGFYIKGLENYYDDPYLLENVKLWKKTIGANRILIVSKTLFDRVETETANELIRLVDLVDVYINFSQGSHKVAAEINSTIHGILAPGDGPFIHWSLSGVSQRRTNELSPNTTLAATLMELMLPGSPSIFYGDEVALQTAHDPLGDHSDVKHLHHLSTMVWNTTHQFTSVKNLPWLPRGAAVSFENLDVVASMISLRETSPSIYQNIIKKPSKTEQNTSVKDSPQDVLVLERWYPRRRSFVSITNFGNRKLSLDLSSMFYSGEIAIGKLKGERVLFSDFEIGPTETVIVRLDK